MILIIAIFILFLIMGYFIIKYLWIINWIIKYKDDIDIKTNKIKSYMIADRKIIKKIYLEFYEYIKEPNEQKMHQFGNSLIENTKLLDEDIEFVFDNISIINSCINHLYTCISNKK